MRKKFKKFLAITMIGMLCVNLSTLAADVSELEEQKEEQQQKKDEAQAVVDQLKEKQDGIMSAIEELDAQVNTYTTQIIDIQNQKMEIQDKITVLEGELETAKAEENRQYEAMKRRIQYAYENDDIKYIDTVFSSSDVSDIINQQEYIEQIYNYDSNMLDGLIEARKVVANKEVLLQTSLDALNDLETQVTANQQAVEVLMNGKMDQVKNYTESIENYEGQVAEYQAGIDEMDNQIAAAEAAAEAEKQERIRKAKEEAERRRKEKEQQKKEENKDSEDSEDTEETDDDEDDDDYEEPMFYETTPTSLQWPVSTGGVITSEFGPRWGSNHNGLDIGCPMYTPIVAAESGTVLISEYESSCGNYVIIDHGGGMTTVYMHNSELLVSVGQYVERGQVIAYAGSTGWSTGPHCHIGVRVNGSYVDPYPYLTN